MRIDPLRVEMRLARGFIVVVKSASSGGVFIPFTRSVVTLLLLRAGVLCSVLVRVPLCRGTVAEYVGALHEMLHEQPVSVLW